VSARELVVLGTSSQTPTRERNHNGYLLRWDGTGLLFDPGEGSQRQMIHAGATATEVDRLLLTHFHGDHCLGVPGVLARRSLDRAATPLVAHYPASGAETWAHLRGASLFYATHDVVEQPVAEARAGVIAETPAFTLSAAPLEHSVDTYGYRLDEPDGVRMLPDALAQAGVRGPDVSRLRRDGAIEVDGRTVTLDEVSTLRPGQSFAFVMDTRLCDNVYALARGVDMLVIESTYLDAEQAHATGYGHLTASDAARVAQAGGVRTLVLTHFSQRYGDTAAFGEEAASHFSGEIVVATDLARIPLPVRPIH
jgi:ribonuclease Z